MDPTVTTEPNQLGDTAITEGVTPVYVPADRYRTRAFADLERERLWPTVWQVAATIDHVPEPGDFYEYRCGELSVLIVRGDDGELRAFQNSCRHRGNTICHGAGSGLTELRCPFHRWAWDLQGALCEVPSRRAFGPGMRFDDLGLFRVQVDTWGPLVFVNLDPTAMSLADYLEEVPADCAWADLEDFGCDVAVTLPVESNWKVVAEGFSETYHVQGIHHEMLGAVDDIHAPQRLWGRHGVSYQNYGVASPRLGRDVSDQEIWDAFILTQGARMGIGQLLPVPHIPEGETVADVIADRIRGHQGARGVDLYSYPTEQIMRLSQYNLFPNTTVLVQADMVSVLVARPGANQHEALLTMFNHHRRPTGSRPNRVAEHLVPGDTELGLVMGQDVELLRTAQVGLRQPALTHLAVGSEECRIINLHRNLEQWLGISPSELVPIR